MGVMLREVAAGGVDVVAGLACDTSSAAGILLRGRGAGSAVAVSDVVRFEVGRWSPLTRSRGGGDEPRSVGGYIGWMLEESVLGEPERCPGGGEGDMARGDG